LWFIATALILLIEIVRERFNRTYIATIMQIMVLALLYQFGVGQLISMATLIILTILLRRLFLKKGRERP
jgi:membrane protein implicated in regulation of membrane protease activity